MRIRQILQFGSRDLASIARACEGIGFTVHVTACILALVSTPFAGGGFDAGLATISEADLKQHLGFLAGPQREGRDSPSQGQIEAAHYLESVYTAAGWIPAPDSNALYEEILKHPLPGAVAANPDLNATAVKPGTLERPFMRRCPKPDEKGSLLRLISGADQSQEFVYSQDFVPLAHATGEAAGELLFVGFGIESKEEHFDELDGVKLKGKIALIVDGEPRHPKRFEGPEISAAASLWTKLADLSKAQVAGVLVVRRPYLPPEDPAHKSKAPEKPASDAYDQAGLGFRNQWAFWNGSPPEQAPKDLAPALEITPECARTLLGEDVNLLAARIEKTMHAVHLEPKGRRIVLTSKVELADVELDNLVAFLPGSDPKLADEYVVIGAHYDHIGVDPRGRIGFGADDNASGSAGLMELVQALSVAGPRRTIIACSFSAEEKGLLGSKAFCAHLPVPKEKIVAMINMDMIGRGDASEVAVLGVVQNPGFERLLERARKLHASGVSKIVLRQGEELFARSDHYSFHQIGIPALFFFEGLPIDKNPDYHTWRDTLDKLDLDKMLRTTRLVFATTWLLANDDERPPRPQG